MKLKNNNSKRFKLPSFEKIKGKIKEQLTFKNLIVFFVSFFLIAFVIGIIFYFYISTNDKAMIKSNLYEYFTVPDNYQYFEILWDSLVVNITNTFFIWVLGISVVGILVIFILYFIEAFSFGFSCSGLLNHYGMKGILGIFCYVFPGKIVYLANFIFISIAAFVFSMQLIKYLFLKKNIDLKKQMKKYFKVLIISVLITIIYTLLEVFVSPLMIKIFTNI